MSGVIPIVDAYSTSSCIVLCSACEQVKKFVLCLCTESDDDSESDAVRTLTTYEYDCFVLLYSLP